MATGLEAIPRGHTFAATSFTLSRDWVREYTAAVGDSAIARVGADLVPPMGVAALAIRALLEQASLPPGAVHLSQDLRFHAPAEVGDRLEVAAQVVSRGERAGSVLMSIQLLARKLGGETVASGRATIAFLSAEAA